MQTLVTIKSFLTSAEANMMQSLLDSEGFYSFLKDENSVVTAPYLANAIGGVKLQVREEDVEKAIQILKEAGYFQENKSGAIPSKDNKILITLITIIVVIFLIFFIKSIPIN